MESGSKPWTDRHGVTWQWIDARGYPFVRRSGPLYHCTACNKSGSGHQHPRHCKSQEHADKVREVERTAALRAAAGGAAEADRTVAVADARAAAARTRVHTTAPAAAAAAAAAVDIRSLTPSPAPKVVTPHTELVLNGMQPFVCGSTSHPVLLLRRTAVHIRRTPLRATMLVSHCTRRAALQQREENRLRVLQ